MFPIWMEDILSTITCSHCPTRLTIRDIGIVGVRRPESWEAFMAEPIFVICFICRNCGQQTNALHRQPLKEVIAGITAFVKLIEQECQGKEPQLKIPGLMKPASDPLPLNAPSAPQESKRLRPSLRAGQPVTPPTQAEIRAFLNRMRKTSFKRSSKTFNNWMKGFGVDANGDSK